MEHWEGNGGDGKRRKRRKRYMEDRREGGRAQAGMGGRETRKLREMFHTDRNVQRTAQTSRNLTKRFRGNKTVI